MFISAGPYFKINPSISFHIRCNSIEEVDYYYEKLSNRGKILMELSEYPFSKRYAWVKDTYGVSWQIIHTEKQFMQKIVPALMFTQTVCGKAREAITYYTDVFPRSHIKQIIEYGKNEFNEKETNVMYSEFMLSDQEFIAMDSGMDHAFTFTEAVSLIVHCDTQKEIDYYWEKLSHVKEAEQCGWLKDKFGVSWQITPTVLGKMLQDKDAEKVSRVTEALLKMKKFDLTKLQEAYEGTEQ
jgi:predicted 3-demethylubiquinone-9 3-methyltransferase (glyoxalase superfamily)